MNARIHIPIPCAGRYTVWITLLADPPAIKMAKHSRKLPAAICVPGIFG